MERVKFRSAFGYDVEAASNECAIFVEGPSLTLQSMADDADINTIIRRFNITGVMPSDDRIKMYGDFSGLTDYQSALDHVLSIGDNFMRLSAEVRARFHNNPQELLDFCGNDANIEEARKLGLLKESVDGPGQGGAGSGVGGSVAATGDSSGGVLPVGQGRSSRGGETSSTGTGAGPASD